MDTQRKNEQGNLNKKVSLPGSKPKNLLLDDDEALSESGRRLFEAHGAEVFIGCRTRESVQTALDTPADLVLIDATNVGFRQGEFICEAVKQFRPEQRVALLLTPETDVPASTRADHVIFRSGPRRILTEVNELLANRLTFSIWDANDDSDQVTILHLGLETKFCRAVRQLIEKNLVAEYLQIDTPQQLVEAVSSHEIDLVLGSVMLSAGDQQEACAYLQVHCPSALFIRLAKPSLGKVLLRQGDLPLWDVISTADIERVLFSVERAVRCSKQMREKLRCDVELNQAKDSLLKNQRSISVGRLLGSIAHEINNPLEAVSNLLFLAQMSSAADERTRSCLEMAEKELQRVAEITKQMLSYHRQRSTKEHISITDAMEDVLALHGTRMRQSRIEVVRQYRCDGYLIAFRGDLRQVLANLVANAIDAMPDGGRLVMRVRQQRTPVPKLVITVADSGIGMPRQVANKMGDLFFTTKGDCGTGIGMWVTRKLIDKYEGMLRVYSSTRPTRSGTALCVSFTEPHIHFKSGASESSPFSREGIDESYLSENGNLSPKVA